MGSSEFCAANLLEKGAQSEISAAQSQKSKLKSKNCFRMVSPFLPGPF